jgi:Rrf2 family cysteine metabolism transcriptional repressor
MLSISTKGRYATRAMLDLALRHGDEPVHLSDISKTQKMSKKYLGRLMAALVSAGFVRSRRGKNGGFTLARSPAEISVLNILQSVEGPVAPAPCLDALQPCRESEDCATREVWAKVKDVLISVLGGITLEDLARGHREKQNSANEPIYVI